MLKVMRMLSDPRIRKGKFAQRGSNKRKMETDEGTGEDTKLWASMGPRLCIHVHSVSPRELQMTHCGQFTNSLSLL